MGCDAIARMRYISNYNDRVVRINWLESYSHIFKFYCVNAYFKYGNEYSCHRKISTNKKRVKIYTENNKEPCCKETILMTGYFQGYVYFKKYIKEKNHLDSVMTLSPLTPMATHYHIRNGAKLIKINPTSQNFEYKIL